MDKIKLAQRTIAMLSSMIESGECHTTRSREMKDNALNGLEQLTIPDVVDSEAEYCDRCGEFKEINGVSGYCDDCRPKNR